MFIVRALFLVNLVVAEFCGAYLAMLGIAALVGNRKRRAAPDPVNVRPATRFVVVVPAHDEEVLLGRLLRSLAAADYPQSLYETVVVADNCSDSTFGVARGMGVRVLERVDAEHAGKGHALKWLIDRLLDAGERYDAWVFFDADSRVSPGFLRVMDRELRQRPGILQGHNGVENVGDSWLTAVTALAFSLQQYVKPLGRSFLGLSTRLLGNGMCFPGAVIESHGWGALSISEDMDFYLGLLRLGYRVRLVPDAVVTSEMPSTRAEATSQRVRWEKGKLLAASAHVPGLLLQAARTRDPVLIDAAVELLIPPFTVLVAWMLALGLAGHTMTALQPVFAPVGWWLVAMGLVSYAAAGAVLTRLPCRILLRSLVAAPFFAAWKMWILLLAIVGINDRTWVRTPR